METQIEPAQDVIGEDASARKRSSMIRRFVTFPLVRIVIGVVLLMFAAGLVQVTVRALQRLLGGTASTLSPAGAVPFALVALATYVLFVRWFERRPVSELAPSRAATELAAGAGLGVGVMGLTIGTIWACGGYSVIGANGIAALLAPLSVAVASGCFEELLFRGVIFRITESSLGTWAAIVITSALFGAAHLANRGATLWSGVAIALEAGVLLGAAYVVSRSLWLPIGLHFGWNFAEAGLLGATVSGADIRGLVTARFEGPQWLTGGSFGPEASVPAVAVCLAIACALLVIAARRGNLQAPAWKRSHPAPSPPRL